MATLINSSKLPKVNYKKQLKSEMIKSFNRFFSSSSSDQIDTTNIRVPGEEPIYDLKKAYGRTFTNYKQLSRQGWV